jgi:hypothetical protein
MKEKEEGNGRDIMTEEEECNRKRYIRAIGDAMDAFSDIQEGREHVLFDIVLEEQIKQFKKEAKSDE